MKPEELLTGAEESVPGTVKRAQRFLRERGMWHRFARNSPATSCRDAAHRRQRLGRRGIPLWDELKSLSLVTSDGRMVLVHCRGDLQVDMGAVQRQLGTAEPVTAMPLGALEDLGFGYGLVNPFETWPPERPLQIVHVFDEQLRTRLGVPGTMMTNAGDRTWAVEFYADELIARLETDRLESHRLSGEVIVAPIALHGPATLRPPYVADRRTIGIVTGNAPESGIALWQHTITSVRSALGHANRGDISMPPVEVVSLPELGLSMELDQRVEPVFDALAGAVEVLCRGGCRLVSVACNTTQYFGEDLDAICRRHGAEFVSMPIAVASWLRSSEITSVGLVGIKYVSDLGEWSAYGAALAEFDVEVPSSHGMKRIEELAYQVKADGPSLAALGRLHNVLRDEIQCQHIVLALTELSVLLDLQPKKRHAKTLIDPLRLYGEALAARYLGPDDPESARWESKLRVGGTDPSE